MEASITKPSSSAFENVDPNVMVVEASTLPTESAKNGPRSRRRQKSGVQMQRVQKKSQVGDGYKIDSAESDLTPNKEIASSNYVHMSAKRTGSKHKRHNIIASVLDAEEKCSLINQFQSEIGSLVHFFREDEGKVQSNIESRPRNTLPMLKQRAEIASLVEGSSLSFSKLVTEIYGKLCTNVTDPESSFSMTLCTLRGSILSIGERIMFGILNPDADVLEDDSERCLWCWEVRDIKLFPESQRSLIMARRLKRKKIGERISALSAIITILTLDIDDDGKEQHSVMVSKAEETLVKTDDEASIRNSVRQWEQKKSSISAAKEVKIKEKEALKEKREMEKKQKRLEKDDERKRLQQEKERERFEKEANRPSLKEEKELRRQQEEAEKGSKMREAAMRKQSALLKQANLMGRFLHSLKKDHKDVVPSFGQGVHVAHDQLQENHNNRDHDEFILMMDHEILNNCQTVESLFNSHKESWRAKIFSQGRKRRWGERRLPKIFASAHNTQTSSGSKRSRKEFEDENGCTSVEKADHEWCESMVSHAVVDVNLQCQLKPSLFSSKRRKLLQFDKSYRPAYYGSFSKMSANVRPRNPLRMDPTLDYENDSDEEWEEEDPGESLSDCDKDDDNEKCDADEDDEMADGFVVPDGYLSESEGAHGNDSDYESDKESSSFDKATQEAHVSILSRDGDIDQEVSKFARQRKALLHLTEQGLKCNRPYVISNFHTKPLNVALKSVDRLCLEALKICSLNEVSVNMPVNSQLERNEDVTKPGKQKSKNVLTDSAIREMAETLMSSPHRHGLKRLAISFSAKFPLISRFQLKSKIKEIADFVDNHWTVKKEVIEQLGLTFPCVQVLPSIPESPMVKKSTPMRLKPITKFFSKRCLPPETAGLDDPSPHKKKGKESYENGIPIVKA